MTSYTGKLAGENSSIGVIVIYSRRVNFRPLKKGVVLPLAIVKKG